MDRIPGYWSHKNDASSIPTIVTLFMCGYQGLEIVRRLVAAIGRDANIQDVLAGRDPRTNINRRKIFLRWCAATRTGKLPAVATLY